MDVFWREGFHGTSTQMLVEAMEVNRFSLYAEFGSKQSLYEAALTVYEREVVDNHFRALEHPDAGLLAVQAMFEGLASAAGQEGSELGCFMCNCATERAPYDPGSQFFVHHHVERMSAAFTNALKNAQAQKMIQSGVDTLKEGHLLATLILGFFVLLRAKVSPVVVLAAVQGAKGHLQQIANHSG